MTVDEFPHFEIEFQNGKLSKIRSVNCGDDYETRRRVAEKQIERLRKQLTEKEGLTNRERRHHAKEINALERTFNLGRFSPVVQVEDANKDKRVKAREKELIRQARRIDRSQKSE
jgi:hypothetical protein